MVPVSASDARSPKLMVAVISLPSSTKSEGENSTDTDGSGGAATEKSALAEASSSPSAEDRLARTV